MPNPTITFIPQRRFYDTATVAETHRRLHPPPPQVNRLDRFHQNLYHFNIH